MAAMRLCKLCLPPSAAARAPSSTWLRKSPGSLLFRNHGISSYVIKATGLKAPNLEPELGGMGSKGISQKWNVKMLYDGECPLCMREVNMLSEKNKSYGTIKFIDISAAEYDPAENGGISYEMAMGKIHAILDDGTIITNVEAFKKLYEAVGLGWVYAITNYEPSSLRALLAFSTPYGPSIVYRLQEVAVKELGFGIQNLVLDRIITSRKISSQERNKK